LFLGEAGLFVHEGLHTRQPADKFESGLMETVLLVIHLILAILLIVAVLMQRSEGGGLGIGGGGGGGGGNVGGFMSVRGTANFLTRATAVIAACFMLTSLTLAILAGNQNTSKSVLDRPGAAETQNQEPKEGQVPLSR